MSVIQMQHKYPAREGLPQREYYCDITRMLDRESNLTKATHCEYYKHYILADDLSLEMKEIAIRLPGRTYGGIYLDENNRILSIKLDNRPGNSGKTPYPDDIDEKLKPYIGSTLQFDARKEDAYGKPKTEQA